MDGGGTSSTRVVPTGGTVPAVVSGDPADVLGDTVASGGAVLAVGDPDVTDEDETELDGAAMDGTTTAEVDTVDAPAPTVACELQAAGTSSTAASAKAKRVTRDTGRPEEAG